MPNDTTTHVDPAKGRTHAQPLAATPARDAPPAITATGLTQSELRRIVLDLIG